MNKFVKPVLILLSIENPYQIDAVVAYFFYQEIEGVNNDVFTIFRYGFVVREDESGQGFIPIIGW